MPPENIAALTDEIDSAKATQAVLQSVLRGIDESDLCEQQTLCTEFDVARLTDHQLNSITVICGAAGAMYAPRDETAALETQCSVTADAALTHGAGATLTGRCRSARTGPKAVIQTPPQGDRPMPANLSVSDTFAKIPVGGLWVYGEDMTWQNVSIARFGGPEVLELAEQPTIPDPGPGEVRIEVLVPAPVGPIPSSGAAAIQFQGAAAVHAGLRPCRHRRGNRTRHALPARRTDDC